MILEHQNCDVRLAAPSGLVFPTAKCGAKYI